MNDEEQLNSFTGNLLQEINDDWENEGTGDFRINQFTKIAGEYLIAADAIEDVNVCYHKSRGMQLNGYNVPQDEDSLELFVSIFNQQSPPASVTKSQVEAIFRQAYNAVKKGLEGYYSTLEESSEVYDMFQRIYEIRNQIKNIKIFLLTDGIVNLDSFLTENTQDNKVSYHVWDIRRIYRFVSSGKKSEAIEIDFQKTFDTTIPCLPMADPESDYHGYLAVLPGEVIAGIYDKYGARLLERNVRSFLQARGNVNKGIRRTILQEPHRFFAYNNGLSATADEISFSETANGIVHISKVRNLQIVNGGQTTASLYHTSRKDKASLKGIYVQAKLSVIPPDQIDEIVPFISRYANSQNKVSDADFFANDPFHLQIQELSRSVWSPAIDGGFRQTKWFYERARGQYLDAKSLEVKLSDKRAFEQTYPKSQKFEKTDLAKYENTWMQLPHLVSLGAQKNFNHFSIRLKERGKIDANVKYYQQLIAKAILFKRAERLIAELNFGGYRAQKVTYTLAWLSHHTAQRIDLDSIWKSQDISTELQEAIKEVSYKVNEIITNPPNARNITEWCKRKECWDAIRVASVQLKPGFYKELVVVGQTPTNQPDKSTETPNAQEMDSISAVSDIPAQTWFNISKWAKETNNLQAWQRSLAFSIGRILTRGSRPSQKQADHGLKIIAEAKSLGFG